MTTDNSAPPARLSEAAVRPITLDPAGPLDDLTWLDDVIGDARVVALGESAHYNGETYRLRHRMLRYLVERHGFGAYTLENGFVEGRLADRWVRGGSDELGDVLANAIGSLTGLWTQVRDHLEWMRRHNRTADRPVGFYGVDLGGTNVSPLAIVDLAIDYLARADPEYTVDPALRETLVSITPASAFSSPAAFAAYGKLTPEAQDALTAGLVRLTARVAGRRLEHMRRTTAEEYELTLHALRQAITLDTVCRALATGDMPTAMDNRDITMADTVEWIRRRQDRILLAAHNGHVQRWAGTPVPGAPGMTPMGLHLADRIGDAYRVIGVTNGTGQTLNTVGDFYGGELFMDLPAPEPDSLDGVLAASHDGPFAVDLRHLSAADTATLRAVSRQRYGHFYADLSPLDAYDAVVHLPHVTAATPDADALAHSPEEVREVFARWQQRA